MFWLGLLVGGAALLFLGREVGRALIRARLGGYRSEFVRPDEHRPERLRAPRSVAVLGGGIAGLTAAVTLARRGYAVTIYEKEGYLGGKLGSERRAIGGGATASVSHGFHAFFSHYHNLNRFLDSLGLRRGFVSIEDYVILEQGGQVTRFSEVDDTPVFNLLSLLGKGLFSLRDALALPGRDLYGIFLEYDADDTFRRYDGLSYAEFSRRGRVPPRLKIAFNTFARAFFADEEKLSLAQLVKAFHFYYLSHDGGLIYDYPKLDYERGLMGPIAAELRRHGAEIRLNDSARGLTALGQGYLVNGQKYDGIVCALDPAGLGRLMQTSAGLPDDIRERLGKVRAGQRYAVYRLWLDRDARLGLPVFVITERQRVLDSVTFYHRFENETLEDLTTGRLDARTRAVLELHCYSVPDDLPDDQVREQFLRELHAYFPELHGAEVLHESFTLKQDFTAFHVGLEAERPPVATGLRSFYCAGDWVKLPFPAMLLEAAASSGYLAANGLLEEDGLAPEPVTCVPLRGLMAGLRAPKARGELLARGPEEP